MERIQRYPNDKVYRPTTAEIQTALKVMACYNGNRDPAFNGEALLDVVAGLQLKQLETTKDRVEQGGLEQLLRFLPRSPWKYIDSHLLSSQPSSRSFLNWSVYHPKYDPDVNYIESSNPGFRFSSHDLMQLKQDDGKFVSTGIGFTNYYGRACVGPVDKVDYSYQGRTSVTYPFKEKWITRKNLSNGIDPRVVVFWDANEGNAYYVKLEAAKQKGIVATLMQRIDKN